MSTSAVVEALRIAAPFVEILITEIVDALQGGGDPREAARAALARAASHDHGPVRSRADEITKRHLARVRVGAPSPSLLQVSAERLVLHKARLLALTAPGSTGLESFVDRELLRDALVVAEALAAVPPTDPPVDPE